MQPNKVVSREEWLDARRTLLEREKAFTRERDRLSEERRKLPWVRVEKEYAFDSVDGQVLLRDLFANASQLIVYHFMYGPDWEEGCPSCSFWADNFNGIDIHLKHRDISLVAVSRAPLETIQAYRERMGWDFSWVSSEPSDFNFDYGVSFTAEAMENGDMEYNYAVGKFPSDELPGVSVFHRNDQGEVFHSYSAYARGLDILNGAYNYMDLTPRGRDESELPYSMAWLRRRDQYDD